MGMEKCRRIHVIAEGKMSLWSSYPDTYHHHVKVLKKRQKKTSTRLSDRVIVRQRSKSKCHHHVKEPRAFGKARSWGVLLTTPCGRSLTKVREKLISGCNPKMLTSRVVRMRYP